MKIQDTANLGAASAPGTQGAVGAESTGRKEADRGVKADGDKAELSGLAGKISEAVAQDSAARAARVEQLHAAVASGSYHPDAAATSQSIVKEALADAAGAGGSGSSRT